MCTCFPPIGVVCAAHCKGEYCRDGEHVDLCAGPTRNRELERLHRMGVPITEQLIATVLGVERAFREVFA
ncbi:hypothetical protein GCM10010399_63890 [Dactylosporangium fulvum]|uniref:Uncharacterized protein n=1 Tax=Dactylosporangium fulvum TaxID=53359 RepID=A0ABY5W704_9ACTN|nr:hypothetical protein [Dactylosporangium fulvum]UWP85788.1 hypothetical protein Dfulv_16710 [Dactylosporangium fulvum]